MAYPKMSRLLSPSLRFGLLFLMLNLSCFTATAERTARDQNLENLRPFQPANVVELAGQVKAVDIFLLMGQSNMKGRGVIDPERRIDRRIVMMHMRSDAWFFAQDPLHLVGQPDTFDGSDNAGVGPGLSFAEAVLEKHPDHLIVLIPCAVGGSSITPWRGRGAKFYDEAVRRAKLAVKSLPVGARLRGVLWMQGESDATEKRHATYEKTLVQMVRELREDLDSPSLPFVAATIREFKAPGKLADRFPYWASINDALLAATQALPHAVCVDLRDITNSIGDGVHYDSRSQKEIGQRLAKAWATLSESP